VTQGWREEIGDGVSDGVGVAAGGAGQGAGDDPSSSFFLDLELQLPSTDGTDQDIYEVFSHKCSRKRLLRLTYSG
jgi:hypothetical protein